MPYTERLQKLIEKRQEKERRRKERERKKAEYKRIQDERKKEWELQEREKSAGVYQIKKRKYKRRKQKRHYTINRDRTDKKREELLERKREAAALREAEKELKGDKKAYHMVIITKNHEKVATMGVTWWKTNAYELFNDLVEENRATVKFPVKVYLNDDNEKVSVKYEILLLQKTEEEQKPFSKRNEEGKFLDSIIVDADDYNILEKMEWYVEETFDVYGYHPTKDRKDFNFILNNLILKDLDAYSSRLVFQYLHRVIIQFNDDIEFVNCKTKSEARRLMGALEKACVSQGKGYVTFVGNVTKSRIAQWVLNEIEEKSGWRREKASSSRIE